MERIPRGFTTATAAAYLRYGIEVGLIDIDEAQDWAYGIVADLDVPPIEIIEVASSNRRDDAISRLSSVAKQGDIAAAAAALIFRVGEDLRAQRFGLRYALNLAMKVATVAEMPDTIYYAFDGVDDALGLAESGTYGTIEEAYAYAMEEFERYGKVPERAI